MLKKNIYIEIINFKNYFRNFNFQMFMNMSGKIYRSKDNRQTLFFKIKNQGFYIKKFYNPSLFCYFKVLFRINSSIYSISNELLSFELFRKIGIKTPILIGYGFNKSFLLNESFLISKELKNCQQLDNFIRENIFLFKQNKIKILNTISDILIKLHKNKVTHNDLYLCHFFISLESLQKNIIDIYLIDFHRVKKHYCNNNRGIVKDLGALYFSMIEVGLTKDDLLIVENSYIKSRDTSFNDFNVVYERANKLLLKYQRKYKK